MRDLRNVVIDEVEMFLGSRKVYAGNHEVELTGLEFNLLWLLMKTAPQIVSRECIAKNIFNRSLCEVNRSINMHVSTIRKKLEENTEYSRIKTIRGEGYIFLVR